jgi:DNA-binding NarL/FixJ family response regulator
MRYQPRFMTGHQEASVCSLQPQKRTFYNLQLEPSVFSGITLTLPAPSTDTLSPEELQVLKLVCLGKTSSRIAQDLGISVQASLELKPRLLIGISI